jgi:uncharacterized membrane protein YbjE (DUF340 family)
MKRYILSVLLLLFLAVAVLAVAQAGTAENGVASLLNTFDLSWWTVDDGGATAVTGGDYSLGGTIGQADTAVMSGGGYALSGGFWRETINTTYLPLVVRQ